MEVTATAVYAIVVAAVSCYMVGGINGAIVMSSIVYHDDIRTQGSGNAGFTNFRRVHGTNMATLCVVLIDILKTLGPVIVTAFFFKHIYGEWQLGAALAMFGCMLGHCYPVWYSFKGGKGVLAGLSAIWVVDIRVGIAVAIIFVAVLIVFNFMSLASCAAMITAPISLYMFGPENMFAVVFLVATTVLVLFRHEANIERLMNGTESKFIKRN